MTANERNGINQNLACSRPSVGGAVRRAPGERGKNEGGRALADSLAFLLAAVFVRYHQLRAWNRLIKTQRKKHATHC